MASGAVLSGWAVPYAYQLGMVALMMVCTCEAAL